MSISAECIPIIKKTIFSNSNIKRVDNAKGESEINGFRF